MNTTRIHQLKNKFIKMFMIAIVLVMVVMGALINVTNYITTRRLVYSVLTYITENQGSVQTNETKQDDVYNQFSPEYRYSMRYFTVLLDEDQNAEEVKVNHIASVDKTQAKKYAKRVLNRTLPISVGRVDNYYYKITSYKNGNCMVAFVDGTTQIRFIERIATFSVLICGICLAATWIILHRVSMRLVRPEIENMKRQKQFITNASHELKTPLAVIRANMEVEEMISGESEWTQSTVRQVDRMDGLIQNLVMITRAEETEDSTGMVDTDVSKVVEESVDPFNALAKQDQKELIREIQPDVHMVTNGSMMRQLTSLLVDNAIKYCDENGSVKIELKEARGRKGAFRKTDLVVFTVSNTYQDGENVDYTRFFDRFYREDKSHNVDKGGYGIGLSVAESICRQYGGTIRADFCFEVLRMSGEGDTEGLTAYLLAGIRDLAAAGAEVGALACNTGHLVFDELQKASPIPLVSIVETACAEAVRRGYRKVGLMGTFATMEADFFKAPFRKAGIEVVTPDAQERAYIADHILNELEMGIVSDQTAAHILKIMERMAKEQQIETVVLGCTELPLLFEGRTTPVPLLDTMQIHIKALIDTIMEE